MLIALSHVFDLRKEVYNKNIRHRREKYSIQWCYSRFIKIHN